MAMAAPLSKFLERSHHHVVCFCVIPAAAARDQSAAIHQQELLD
jgi:hypothetical protein